MVSEATRMMHTLLRGASYVGRSDRALGVNVAGLHQAKKMGRCKLRERRERQLTFDAQH